MSGSSIHILLLQTSKRKEEDDNGEEAEEKQRTRRDMTGIRFRPNAKVTPNLSDTAHGPRQRTTRLPKERKKKPVSQLISSRIWGGTNCKPTPVIDGASLNAGRQEEGRFFFFSCKLPSLLCCHTG